MQEDDEACTFLRAPFFSARFPSDPHISAALMNWKQKHEEGSWASFTQRKEPNPNVMLLLVSGHFVTWISEADQQLQHVKPFVNTVILFRRHKYINNEFIILCHSVKENGRWFIWASFNNLFIIEFYFDWTKSENISYFHINISWVLILWAGSVKGVSSHLLKGEAGHLAVTRHVEQMGLKTIWDTPRKK